MISRRDMLIAGAAGAASLGGCAIFSSAEDGRLPETRIGGRDIVLTAHERETALNGTSLPLWLYAERPYPIFRMKLGETLGVTLRNALREHTSIHWHGVRVPNAMDGVPYLTQLPVQPGEEFAYRFAPPDAGTFFFHPHCNTIEQMGRGLLGALIVEDPREVYDDDLVLVLKDWRLGEDDKFLPFLTNGGASKAGSFGALRTVNAAAVPSIALRSRENVRIRLINADSSRIAEIGIEDADARVVAVDGNNVTPFALETWRLGPGMRLDLVVQTSGDARLMDYFSASPELLATLRAGETQNQTATLDTAHAPFPDFTGAWHHTLELGAGVVGDDAPPAPILLPDGRRIDIADSLCLAAATFWTLDGRAWPGRDHANLPPPLFSLTRGQKAVIEIANTTSRAHPIHLHGHTMSVLSASVLKRPVHRADTVLVLPNERVTVGLVADNPGNWMIHCHVIEHQETGMMGWFRVS